MEMLFMKIIDMSMKASIVIAVICLARLLLRKAPKGITYFLWAVVLFRLLCPISISSPISFMPEETAAHTVVSRWSETVILETRHDPLPAITIPEQIAVSTPTPEPALSVPVKNETPSLPLPVIIWLLGMTAAFTYSVISLLILRKKIGIPVLLRRNIYFGDAIASPFVLGILNPRIYLPTNLLESEQEYIIAHEEYHIRHLDHLAKLLFFVALCTHWFNPLVWLAFILFTRDMEMRCDEAIVNKLGSGIRADYCTSLLNLAVRNKLPAVLSLPFGGNNTMHRIKNLAAVKKTGIGFIALTLVFSIALSACLATDPKVPETQPEIPETTAVPEKTPEELAAEQKELEAELRAIEAALYLEQKQKDKEIYDNWLHGGINGGHLTVAFAGEHGLNDVFPEYTYEGEELNVKAYVDVSGTVNQVGLLLFLNGKPQTYRLKEDTKYSYMTIFDRQELTRAVYQNLYLVPMDGAEGETMNLEIVAITNPNYFLEDSNPGLQYTGMRAAAPAKVKFLKDPISVTQPEVTSRVISVTEETMELNEGEILSLQETDSHPFCLPYDLPYRLFVNGRRGDWGNPMSGIDIYSFKANKPMEVVLEMYGDPVGEYGFNLFVNNIPVSAEPLAIIHTEEGTKVKVKVLLDMSDFDGSAVIYGTLAARNFEGYRNPNGAVAAQGLFETQTFYLTSAEDIYEILGISDPHT